MSSLNREAVFHTSNGVWAYQEKSDELVIILRAKKGDIKEVKVRFGDQFMIVPNKNFKKGDEWRRDNVEWLTEEPKIMKKYVTDELYDYFKCRISNKTKRLQYIFLIESNFNEKIAYGSSYFHELDEWFFRDCFNWGYLDEGNIPQTPKWLPSTIWYQIFPERFRNGDKTNDPKNVLEWESKLPEYRDFFGGDLQGIIEKLDYIAEIGFNGIYMTPIFTAGSNHKYDTIKYNEIDPAFGTEELFKQFMKECKKRGIKVMLDGVFNHIGALSPIWQDVMKNKSKSKYKDWFKINDIENVDFINKRSTKDYPKARKEFAITYPYETFAFSPMMPRFNWNNKELREFLFKSIEKWTKMGIDGWRLDVANEPSFEFWREFKRRVKDINPDVYIMGEVMYDAKPFLEGDMFDSVMNYKLRDAIVDYVVDGITKDDFEMMLGKNIVRYKKTIQDAMFNLLDSHDKPRLLTLLNVDIDKYLLAYSILFLMSGSLCVYYGDEIGLEGKHDPDNRRCMIWDESRWNMKIQNKFKQLIKLRKQHSSLQSGEYEIIKLNHPNLSLIIKKNDDECLLCFINFSNEDVIFDTNCIKEESRIENKAKILAHLKKKMTKIDKYSIQINSVNL